MTVKYALHPGFVTSKNDGDRHFINAHQLASCYGVRPCECVVVPWDATKTRIDEIRRQQIIDRIERMKLIHLHPRYDGNYKLPTA